MKRVLFTAVATLACALAVPIAPSAYAADAAIAQVGWWSQRPGASELPAGGFELALSPTGALSQAALRIKVDVPILNSALLELTESQAAGAEVASVVVCPTSDPWEPANPGAWEDAPQPNCAKNVPLSRRSTGEWAGDISALLTTGTAAVVLVPMSHADTQGFPVPYQVEFSGAKLSASAPATPAPAPPPPTVEDFSVPSDEPRIEAAPAGPSTTTGTGPPPVVVAEPRGDLDDDVEPAFAGTTEERGRTRQWWRIAILAPAAALLGAGAVFARRFAGERGWAG